jgi:hypothetical protein
MLLLREWGEPSCDSSPFCAGNPLNRLGRMDRTRSAVADLWPHRRRKNLARLRARAKGLPTRQECPVRTLAALARGGNSGTSTSSAFMQYWLLGYGKTCPNGWTPRSWRVRSAGVYARPRRVRRAVGKYELLPAHTSRRAAIAACGREEAGVEL